MLVWNCIKFASAKLYHVCQLMTALTFWHGSQWDAAVKLIISPLLISFQVDVNVTRHLKGELSAEDWDVMTLHYLGLDHIGHMHGPASNLVAPKLLEMDAVVDQIYTAMNSWVNLKFCVCVLVCDTCECVSALLWFCFCQYWRVGVVWEL